MLPLDENTRKLILKAAEERTPLAELEYLGLSLRVINTLEERMNVIYLKDLIEKSEREILAVKQLGVHAIQQIRDVLERFSELESNKLRWHYGSEKIELYKKHARTLARM